MNFNTQGEAEYRLASFFIGIPNHAHHRYCNPVFPFSSPKEKGSTAFFFLVYYSAAEFVIEYQI